MAMRAVSSVCIDTNVLVYARLGNSPLHYEATTRLSNLREEGNDLWVTRQILREYLTVMTRPGELTGMIPIGDLVRDVDYFETHYRVAEDSPFVTLCLKSLVQMIPVAGKQVHDANIVATMQAFNIEQILTHNTSDFKRFAELVTVLPLVP